MLKFDLFSIFNNEFNIFYKDIEKLISKKGIMIKNENIC